MNRYMSVTGYWFGPNHEIYETFDQPSRWERFVLWWQGWRWKAKA